VYADIQNAPATITLNWESEPASAFQVYRRVKGSTNWGFILSTIQYPTTTYEDTNVEVGVSYEYRIVKNDWIKGEGTINAGIEIEAVEQRGKLVLVVDETHAIALGTEINRLISDIQGDGWAVVQINIDPSDTVEDVKDAIASIYENEPDVVKAVLLLGHIPVPYSGELYPDGHEDHEGAWPADLYYGEMNGTWTDQSVNNSNATSSRHHNVPGDGKFDQSFIPSDIELQVGRIDFHDLPAFADDEQTLLQNYLNKNHAFRHKEFTVPHRGLLENNFVGLPEGFAQSAYRNFSNMFGPDEVYDVDYSTLFTDGYLWSYGCGGGSYSSCNGVVNTSDLASNSLQTVFSMLFGSYFGDFDSQNNLLRSALASGNTLTNAWAGRPKWQFQHMALGENIGYGTVLTQNTSTNWVQDTCFGGRLTHIALMGDPTLRMHVVAPPANLMVEEDNGHAELTWDLSADNVLGYHVYRKEAGTDFFDRVNGTVITSGAYIDSCLVYQTNYEYMVRALRLETSASGSYYNLSQGIMDDLTIQTNLGVTADFTWVDGNGFAEFSNLSTNGTSYFWDFGDGQTSTDENPTLEGSGIYNVSLTVSNECFTETVEMEVTIISAGTEEVLPGVSLEINPIPADTYLQVKIDATDVSNYELALMNTEGKLLLTNSIQTGEMKQLDVAHLPAGIYLLQITDLKGNKGTSQVVLQ